MNPTSPAVQRDDSVRALYVCYLSLSDPLVETQVVAYLEGLAKLGHTPHLLTYEGKVSRRERADIRFALRHRGIRWHHLRYHRRPSLLATAFDVFAGVLAASVIATRHKIDVIHARSHVPALVALVLHKLRGLQFIFDIRGLMAEEYVDAGRWGAGGLAFRLTKRVERRAIEDAAAIVVLTQRVKRLLFGANPRDDVHVIPCCANIESIVGQSEQGSGLRAELGLTDRVVLLYVGKFTGWYMEKEMVEFFLAAREQESRLHFRILTQSPREHIVKHFRSSGVSESDYSIARVPPQKVGGHLAAADAAISLIRPCLSKVSSSPTKIGEYLAAGLPIVSSAGIGDVDELLTSANVGVLLSSFEPQSYAEAARQLWELTADPRVASAGQRLARERLSLAGVGIPAYDKVYRSIARLETNPSAV